MLDIPSFGYCFYHDCLCADVTIEQEADCLDLNCVSIDDDPQLVSDVLNCRGCPYHSDTVPQD